MYEKIVHVAKAASPVVKSKISKGASRMVIVAKQKTPIAVEFIKDKSPEILACIQMISVPARKEVRKLRRVNDLGEKMPKYDLDRLTKLYTNNKINPEMYRYLANEFNQYEDVIKQHPRNFDMLFEKLINTKDMNEGASRIERYETVRDEYLKSAQKSK